MPLYKLRITAPNQTRTYAWATSERSALAHAVLICDPEAAITLERLAFPAEKLEAA